MIPTVQKEDIVPLCPHCNAQLQVVYHRELESKFGKRYIYFCPNCHKTLGVSHRKGFWMG
jgi:uncharacterized protein with PIN domain